MLLKAGPSLSGILNKCLVCTPLVPPLHRVLRRVLGYNHHKARLSFVYCLSKSFFLFNASLFDFLSVHFMISIFLHRHVSNTFSSFSLTVHVSQSYSATFHTYISIERFFVFLSTSFDVNNFLFNVFFLLDLFYFLIIFPISQHYLSFYCFNTSNNNVAFFFCLPYYTNNFYF